MQIEPQKMRLLQNYYKENQSSIDAKLTFVEKVALKRCCTIT